MIHEDANQSVDERPVARIQYVEPETSLDPWKCDYFALPIPKNVIHSSQPLHDMRTLNPQLSTHAFTAIKHQSKAFERDVYDGQTAKEIFMPEITEILKKATGAKTVLVLGTAIRKKIPDPDVVPLRERDPNAEPGRCGIKLPKMDMSVPYLGGYTEKDAVGPARAVHIDYSPDGARRMLRHVRADVRENAKDIIAAEDAQVASGGDINQYEGKRYAFFSVWRPLRKVTRDPVAVCDPNSINYEDDLVEHVNKQPSDGEDYLAGLSMLKGDRADSQKWYWIPEQDVDDVLIFQFFDSYAAREGRPWGAPHGGVQLVGQKDDEDLRNSIEARCVAFW